MRCRPQIRTNGTLDALSAAEQVTEGDSKMFQNQGQCTASLLAVNPVCAYHVVGLIYGVQVCFMLDTGAAISLLRKDVWNDTGGDGGHQLSPWAGPKLVGVEVTPLEVHGVATMEIALAGKYFQVDFVVVVLLRTQSILGLDFMEGNQCVVNAGQKTLHLRGLGVPIQTATRMSCLTESSVAFRESIRIPAFSEVEVMAESGEVLSEGVWLLERLREQDLPVLVAGAVVTPVTAGQATCVPVRLVNPSSVEVVVHKGSKIAVIEQLDGAAVMSVSDEPPSRPKTSQVSMEKQKMLWRVVEKSAEKLTKSKRDQL